MAAVSTDDRGGIRVEWLGAAANVFLVIPHDADEPYIYKEFGDKFETVDASPEELADSLSRFA
jgi:hypothetical protein